MNRAVDKESTCNAGDPSSIPGSGGSPGEGKGYSLQYSGLENSRDYSPWGNKESDMTERLSLYLILNKFSTNRNHTKLLLKTFKHSKLFSP